MKNNNLDFCNRSLNEKVESILNDPAVHSLTKDIIRAGLVKDSLDAVRDTRLALSILKEVDNNH